MPLVWPNRTDCEAFFTETLDLTNVNSFIRQKNKENGERKYSLFPILLASMGKVFLNRPRMNRFYRNGKLYERYDVSIGFIVKKDLSDDGIEALAKVIVEPTDTLATFLEKVAKEIETCRGEALDKSSDDLRILMKFPHFIGKMVMGFMKWLDNRTTLPESITESDMFFKSIVVTNLGSIRLHAGYHHLSNWGTNSFFVTVGDKKRTTTQDENGNNITKETIQIGMTIDERIADGLYFSKTIRLFKHYVEHPECLETPFLEDTPDKE